MPKPIFIVNQERAQEWADHIAGQMIKDCPCCGSKAEIVTEHYDEHEDSDKNFTISCTGCMLKTAPRISKKSALHAWNNRA